MLSDNSVCIVEKGLPKVNVHGVNLIYDSNVYCKTYYSDSECNSIHRDCDLPALYIYNQDDECILELWCRNGKVHRENGPALKCYYKDVATLIEWYRDGRRHREDDEPAVSSYDESGEIITEKWCIDGKLHRENGPAVITYFKNGNRHYESWFVEGLQHRDDGPALTNWCDKNRPNDIASQYWFRNGEVVFPSGWSSVIFRG